VRALADFLRQHYTSKSETAGALAAYVSSFAASGVAASNRGPGATVPAATGGYREVRRRNRGEGEATANGEDAPSQARPAKDSAGHHRRTTNLSSEGEKGRVSNDGEVPRPPGGILTTHGSSKSNARTRREPRDARLRSDLPAEHGAENATEEAGKTGAATARKRRNRVNAERAAPDVRTKTEAKTNGHPSVTTGPGAPGVPQQGDIPPTSARTSPP